MPYAEHLRVTASGVLGGTFQTGAGAPETFSYGFAIGGGSTLLSPSASNNADRMNDYVQDVVAFHGRPGTMIGVNAVLKMVKIARIGPDGKYLEDPYIGEVSQFGGSTSAGNVPQTALAVSLDTDRRGASGRGRFYLPLPIIGPDQVTFLIPNADAISVGASVAQLVTDINNQDGIDTNSNGVVVASSKGFNSRVTSVRIGRVLDTIRSRRRSLQESYGTPYLIGDA